MVRSGLYDLLEASTTDAKLTSCQSLGIILTNISKVELDVHLACWSRTESRCALVQARIKLTRRSLVEREVRSSTIMQPSKRPDAQDRLRNFDSRSR